MPPDPDVTQRPSPSRDFSVPMDCVGDLLMVWDFCTSFGRQLHLWRFSLEDFENAVCHKESNLVLIMEVHACLFRFLINERGDSFKALQRRSRKSKVRSSSHGNHMANKLICFSYSTLSCQPCDFSVNFVVDGLVVTLFHLISDNIDHMARVSL